MSEPNLFVEAVSAARRRPLPVPEERKKPKIETPAALPSARPFNIQLQWTVAGMKQKTVVKVMAGDWMRAVEIAMRSVRLDKIVPPDAAAVHVSVGGVP